jgi:DNA-binding transcriptional ArsR family regulator
MHLQPAPTLKADIGLYIPSEVFQLPLPFITRGILAEVLQLSKRDGICTASDAHFVERFDVSRDTVSRAIQQLEAAGLLHKTVDKLAGNLRRLTPTDGPAIDTLLAAKSDKGVAAKSGEPSRKIRQPLAAKSGVMNKEREVRREHTPPTPVTASRPVGGSSASLVKMTPDAMENGGAARTPSPTSSSTTPPLPTVAAPAGAAAQEPAGFADFYDAWPNRQKRRDAARAFAALPPPDQHQAAARASKWIAEHPRLIQRGSCPYPANWLRGALWEDSPEPPDRSPKPGQAPPPPTTVRTTARPNQDWK